MPAVCLLALCFALAACQPDGGADGAIGEDVADDQFASDDRDHVDPTDDDGSDPEEDVEEPEDIDEPTVEDDLPPAGEYVPGTRYYGEKQFTSYVAGTMPVILAAPHGGRLAPSDIPDRHTYVIARDTDTLALTDAIATALGNRTNGARYPYIIRMHLSRIKVDANRDKVNSPVEVHNESDPQAFQAWSEYHDTFIMDARRDCVARFGKCLYLEIHGHGHAVPAVELGYLLTGATLELGEATLNSTPGYEDSSSIRAWSQDNPMTFAAAIRGSASFGGLLQERGVLAIPSPELPSPMDKPYFNGGYGTARHGSCRTTGSVCAIQLEHPRGVRSDATLRAAYADDLAVVIDTYLRTFTGSGI